MRALLPAFCVSLLSLTAIALPAQEAEAKQPQAADLIQKLGDPSYRARRDAEQALRKLGEAARSELREAASNHADPEVRWRAGRLLAQLEDGAGESRLRARQRPDREGIEVETDPQGQLRLRGIDRARDIQQQFDEMFRRLEREFGIDIPRRSFFHDEFFRDLDEQMKQQMQTLREGALGEGLQMQVGPDGVRVEIKRRTEDGELKTEVYEAPDMESFRARYPEIARRHFALRDGLFRSFPQGWPGPFTRLRMPETEPAEPVEPPAADVADPDRLGVMVGEVTPEVRSFLGLDEGLGLAVQSVLDGSLAAQLGIETGDILLRVAGREIRGVADVREGLAGVESGGKVEVFVNRRGALRELSATKKTVEVEPKPAKEGEAADPDAGKLRRIR